MQDSSVRLSLPVRKLCGSLESTILGFGASALGNLFESVRDEVADATLAKAWDRGIRYFDTAPFYGYGLSEERLGRALGNKPRDEFIVSTKVGRRIVSVRDNGATGRDGFDVPGDRKAIFDYTADGIKRSFQESLNRLSMSRVEVLLLHDIGERTHGPQHPSILRLALEQALPTMLELKSQGACQAIGLGVNEIEVCFEVLQYFDLDCILLGGRHTLLDHQHAGKLLELAQRNVSVIAAAPYNSGLLADAKSPGKVYDYKAVDDATFAKAKDIYRVLKKLDVDAGAVALQFPLRHPAVATVLCGLRSEAEVETAVTRLSQELAPEVWRQLKKQGLLNELSG